MRMGDIILYDGDEQTVVFVHQESDRITGVWLIGYGMIFSESEIRQMRLLDHNPLYAHTYNVLLACERNNTEVTYKKRKCKVEQMSNLVTFRIYGNGFEEKKFFFDLLAKDGNHIIDWV